MVVRTLPAKPLQCCIAHNQCALPMHSRPNLFKLVYKVWTEHSQVERPSPRHLQERNTYNYWQRPYPSVRECSSNTENIWKSWNNQSWKRRCGQSIHTNYGFKETEIMEDRKFKAKIMQRSSFSPFIARDIPTFLDKNSSSRQFRRSRFASSDVPPIMQRRCKIPFLMWTYNCWEVIVYGPLMFKIHADPLNSRLKFIHVFRTWKIRSRK